MKKRARRKFSSEGDSDGGGEWIVTYSDLVTLLLTFFILLFSMATVDKEKFEDITNSLRSSFLHVGTGEIFGENRGSHMLRIMQENNAVDGEEAITNNEKGANNLKNFKHEVEAAVDELNLDEYVSIIEDKEILTLRMDSLILFDSGRADIKESGKEVLKKLGKLLADLEREVVVQGHTDDRPINTLLFPSNWELSTKRATNVVIFLIDNCKIDPTKLTPTGNAEFKPIAPNDTEQNRQKNRRVDIVVKK